MSRTRLSPARRRADRARLANEVVDVLVVGGGLTGAGTALDAVSRGLSVGLLEARDWAAGASGGPGTLLDAGLHSLGQPASPSVREVLQERSRLVRTIAPHLVRPVPFLLPLPAPAWRRAYHRAELALHDVLGAVLDADRGLPAARHLSRRAALAAFPGLRPDAVVGAVCCWDARVDGARHTLAVVRTAAGYGARVLSRARVTGLLRADGPDGGTVVGARVADLTDGSAFTVRARSVVAATGVEGDDVGAVIGDPAHGPPARAAEGVHLVLPGSAIDGGDLPDGDRPGLLLRTPVGVLTVLPCDDHWVVGCTGTAGEPDRAHPACDVTALLDQIDQVLSRPVHADQVLGVHAGPRPAGTGRPSRDRAVATPLPGLVVAAGGEYVTYRRRAADAVDAATAGLPGVPPSRTAHLPLVGAHRWDAVRESAPELAAACGLPEDAVGRLLHRYGDRVGEVLGLVRGDPGLGRPLPGAPAYLAAEVVHAVAAEGALHPDDVLTRRTRVSVCTPHHEAETATAVAELMARVLDREAEREAHHTAGRRTV